MLRLTFITINSLYSPLSTKCVYISILKFLTRLYLIFRFCVYVDVLLGYRFLKLLFRLSIIFNEIFYLIAIITPFSSVINLILDYDVQIYKPNISPIYSILLLVKSSDINLIKTALILFSGRLLQLQRSLSSFLLTSFV